MKGSLDHVAAVATTMAQTGVALHVFFLCVAVRVVILILSLKSRCRFGRKIWIQGPTVCV